MQKNWEFFKSLVPTLSGISMINGSTYKSTYVHAETGVHIYTSHAIEVGEEIYTSHYI